MPLINAKLLTLATDYHAQRVVAGALEYFAVEMESLSRDATNDADVAKALEIAALIREHMR